MRWWAVGLSVMATQISAITFVGTTGQAYSHGMRFLVVYFALPFAMVILCLTLVPFFEAGNLDEGNFKDGIHPNDERVSHVSYQVWLPYRMRA